MDLMLAHERIKEKVPWNESKSMESWRRVAIE